jgi:hypothetical protein
MGEDDSTAEEIEATRLNFNEALRIFVDVLFISRIGFSVTSYRRL